MNKADLLTDIKKALEKLLVETQKWENQSQPMPTIEKDLLLEKTRRLYEKMKALEEAEQKERLSPEENLSHEPALENEPAFVSEPVMEEQPETQQEQPTEKETIPEPPAEKKPETEQQPVNEEKPAEPQQIQDEKPATPEPKEKKPETEEKSVQEKPEEITLDLFSDSVTETVGETLKPSDPAIAETLQSSGIQDLREAIGINDKFLFINEMFHGDMEQYNKVIDELNSFSGLPGAQTYLAELQIQYQWDENSPALEKLLQLLERKFG
ncbi:hypothetical protein LA303_02000 [Candidatus Sulfidibacterium hydrothermale]|uniref:hypothetical protein n=1 Tax=Candidatus Sulfidibacterium hydrothermale TaxID=2875962 RepID=UPI001F0A66DC|nr:hypothetical protein [Candidatus Sulfidibacterium hydrothermale]UBM62766.1 hypothetical protein LA303_02000 [Candidatus Sulfidibacterium hydrothermale]